MAAIAAVPAAVAAALVDAELKALDRNLRRYRAYVIARAASDLPGPTDPTPSVRLLDRVAGRLVELFPEEAPDAD